MININLADTIAAISTALGESGIGIVRISGKDALLIADKIFLSAERKKPSEFKTYTIHYGWIVNRSASEPVNQCNRQTGKSANRQTEVIDEIILTIMRGPKSYTKEDIVEINCHGGIVALRGVLDLVLQNGARLAQPGEFTKRAFLNGRIDLAQSEAVLDIIKAKTDSALRVGLTQLKGGLSKKIKKIRNMLLELLVILEANIDFPEEQTGAIDFKKINDDINKAGSELKDILNTSACGRILREGISAVICGRPNVGKSSLLNALLKQERSIVTPVAGTTRDTIEEIIDIKGIPIRIIDTAGIIEPRDLVEKKAVMRSKQYINSADLVILLFDGNRKLAKEDIILVKKVKKKNVLAIINKIDLKQKIQKEKIIRMFSKTIEISAKKNMHIDALEEAIAELVYGGKLKSSESILVSNQRHIEAIEKSRGFVTEAINALNNKLSSEFVVQDIKYAFQCLDDILGDKFGEELLEKIFSDFCIGK